MPHTKRVALMDIFPEDSLKVLPFTPEPISKWAYECDLMQFVDCLLPYSEYFFDQHRREFQAIANEFSLNANKALPSRAAEQAAETIPNFQGDETFGLAAKYTIAWFIITQTLFEESSVFSEPHMLEAYTELECSVLLASNMYYKQALQTLRGFLENSVLQLHFCHNRDEFFRWKENDYRVPSMRGKNGLLSKLVKQGVLARELATLASNLYDELNGNIHGAERYLIHRGMFTGHYAGQIFKYERFQEWCDYLSRCIDFAIQVQYEITRFLTR